MRFLASRTRTYLLRGLATAFFAGAALSLIPLPDAAADAPKASAKQDTETHVAELVGSGPYAAGKDGSVLVKLTAKGGYHINDKYPLKFKATDPAPEGLTYPKPIVKREDGTFEATTGSLPVHFVASKAGKAKISGVLSMSVCSDANCIMDKIELELDVDVK